MDTKLKEQLSGFAVEHSVNLRILARLFEMTRVNNVGPVCFSILAEEMKSEGMSVEEVSSNVDRLFDFGMISGGWSDVDGFMTRTLCVAGEAEWLARLSYSENI